MENYIQRSIGNDVVDIKGFRHGGRPVDIVFADRILTSHESGLAGSLPFGPIFVPLAWSLKEAAYKHSRRWHAGARFSPKVNEVLEVAGLHQIFTAGCYNGESLLLRTDEGSAAIGSLVRTPYGLLRGYSFVFTEFIFSFVICQNADPARVISGIGKAATTTRWDQSAAVRKLASEFLLPMENVTAGKQIEFIKDPGNIPHIYLDGKKSEALISFSHDAHYVGFSFYE